VVVSSYARQFTFVAFRELAADVPDGAARLAVFLELPDPLRAEAWAWLAAVEQALHEDETEL
jgi:hypothetical protein